MLHEFVTEPHRRMSLYSRGFCLREDSRTPVGLLAAPRLRKQHKLGKPQILCFGALLVTSSPGLPRAFEGSQRKTCGSKGVWWWGKPPWLSCLCCLSSWARGQFGLSSGDLLRKWKLLAFGPHSPRGFPVCDSGITLVFLRCSRVDPLLRAPARRILPPAPGAAADGAKNNTPRLRPPVSAAWLAPGLCASSQGVCALNLLRATSRHFEFWYLSTVVSFSDDAELRRSSLKNGLATQMNRRAFGCFVNKVKTSFHGK
jgi:hypothetical protein